MVSKKSSVHNLSKQKCETRRSPRSNVDDCFLPESVRQYYNEPLYLIVARWCLLQGDWINRNHISSAFRIPSQRASYLLSYLRNKTTRVELDFRELLLSNNIYRCEILVTRVLEAPPTPPPRRKSPPPRVRRRVCNADGSQAVKLWNNLTMKKIQREDSSDKDE